MTAPRANGWTAGEPATAAEWDARLRSPHCTESDQQALEAWRAADRVNAREFDLLQAAVRHLQEAGASDPALRAARDRARTAIRLRWTAITASVAGIALAGGAGYLTYQQLKPAPESVYRTMTGERSTIRLADGSDVMLNSKTEVRVAYRRRERAVTLISGEAMFDVAKDAARPFVVTAGRRSVTAVGTAFDVRLEPAYLQVTMVEGRVKVEPTGSWAVQPSEQFLVAGQRMTAANNSPEVEIRTADLSRDAAWREDKVIFEGETLEAAIVEMNRYTEKPIRIADASLRNLQIFGMFRTNQPDSFVTALTTYYPIRARTAPSGDRLLFRN